jgi:general secretion pathway protein A
MKFSDFGFKENPFAITPDPRYLYMSRGHEESLAHLIYGTGPNGGFVLLTGEVGTGKTLLIRSLLAQKLGEVDIALVLNPRLSRREFMATICDELGIEYQGHPYSLKQMIDALTEHLLKTHSEGRHTVLVVDEAQNLSPRVLEQIRLLTNLETTRYKMLRIILVGQPELLQMLSRKELRQVDQRITARYHLSPLERQETARYITHRLEVAGIREDLFTPGAMRLIHRISGGVPRLINTLCERTLLAIFSRGRDRANVWLVRQAAREVRGKRPGSPLWGWSALAAGLVVMGVAAYLFWSTPAVIEATDESLVIAPVVIPAQKPPEPEPIEGAPAPKVEIAAIEQSAQPLEEVPSVSVPEPAPEVTPQEVADSAIEHLDPARLFSQPQSRQALYHSLFGLWGETFESDSPLTPCMQAPQRGLRCIRERGDWRQMEALDRPFLLRLVQEKQSRLLLVKHKQDSMLVVDDGQGEALLDIDRLGPFWKGEYTMLWKPHSGVALIGEGSAGEAVTWLRQRLQAFDQMPSEPVLGIDRFDPALKSRVQAFQRSHGLLEDGVAGQQTLIYLNNLLPDPATPSLSAQMGEG